MSKGVGIFILLGFLFLTQIASAFYDANVGRWLNRDPADDWGSIVNYLQNVRESEIDFNLYRFVGNAPSFYVDEFGLKWHAGGKWNEKEDTITETPRESKVARIFM